MTEMQKMGQRAKKASQVLATAGKTKKLPCSLSNYLKELKMILGLE